MRSSSPPPGSESDRIHALRAYNILDSAAEPVFDSLTELAAKLCGTSMAVLTFLDERRQWFKSRVGIALTETPREIAFCAHTVEEAQLFEVEDAHQDPRFRENPLVREAPQIRFYAGAPLLTDEGRALGSLAVLDPSPKRLSPEQREWLVHLARHAMLQLKLRRVGWESSERYRVLAEASPLPIIMVDREQHISLWNSAAEQLFGFLKDDVLGKENPLVPPAERESYDRTLRQVFSGDSVVLRDAQLQKRDGTLVHVDFYAAPVRAVEGEAVGGMAIVEDISAQKQAGAQLQQSLSLLTATLESTADGILVVDRKGNILAHNRRFAEIWALQDDVLDGRRDADALSAALHQLKDPAAFLERVNQLYSQPEQDSFDVIELKDGRTLERYSRPQRIGDEIVGRVWSFRDVTERVELEAHVRQSQKLEAVGALAGGIAHDFNNLLNVIIGYNSLLAAELAPDTPLAQYSDKIRYAADRAAGLTRQLLAFSRRQVLRPQVINVNDLINRLSQMFPRLVPEDIEFAIDLAPETFSIRADPGQIEQVLMNLVVNARDAMPRGGQIRISARSEKQQRPDESQVAIEVADSGEGIDPAVLPRIFEPFFTTKPTGRGTGLGLSTAYGIIRQSGGTISVESSLGRGTTFTVRLPLVPPETGALKVAPHTHRTAASASHILLVEDDLALRPLIAHVLRDAGYNVSEAISPDHALQTIAQPDIQIDLLLTDVVMPGMSGGDLATRAQQLRPDLKIAFMSGYPEEDIQHRCGPVGIIEKPFSPEALIEHVRLMLECEPDQTRNGAA